MASQRPYYSEVIIEKKSGTQFQEISEGKTQSLFSKWDEKWIRWLWPTDTVLRGLRKRNKGPWMRVYIIKLIVEALHWGPTMALPWVSKTILFFCFDGVYTAHWRDTGYLVLVTRSDWQTYINIFIKTYGSLYNKHPFFYCILFHYVGLMGEN